MGKRSEIWAAGIIGLIALALGVTAWVSGLTSRERIQDLAWQVEHLSRSVKPKTDFGTPREGAADIRHSPADLPGPVGRREPARVKVELETVELDGVLADGTTYTYWTFNGTVPGPFIRVRAGDTVELTLKNAEDSANIHSIDLHAVTGPGGGAASTQVAPGESKSFTFKALNPGLYIYHCASPHIPTHIAQGMYGLILVEPEEGLPPVDREFYIMQAEVYAAGRHTDGGHQPFDGDLMYREQPNYVVFNGAFQALTGDQAMTAQVGERIRLFVGNAGPNLASSLHVIGEIFDVVYAEGGTTVTENIGVTLIPAGGAVIIEFTAEVPGRYQLVDHSISRAVDKGALAFIDVQGDPDPEIYYDPAGHPMSGH